MRNTVKFNILALIGGFITGVVGLSGASLLNPLLLEMDLIPEVASATTISMLIVNSLGLVMDYTVNGGIILDYALPLALCTFLGSASGILVIRSFLRKFQR